MGPNTTSRIKTIEISKRQGKSTNPIRGPMVSKHERHKKQQEGRKATFGYQQNYKTLLLVALLSVCIWVSPTAAEIFTVDTANCADCHSQAAWEQIHNFGGHAALPDSAQVVIHADTAHDDAGRVGSKPYFAILVDCSTCHNYSLLGLHGNRCATCHPTPYDTLEGNWNKGCLQGGCHQVNHEDSIKAHLPFENVYDPENDCTLCHIQTTWAVTQAKCLNCHAAYVPGDVTPPETSTNAQDVYIGPAKIDFSITDNGKVGVGTTFYRLEGGEETTGMSVFVTTPGDHQLVYWSKDQAGNVELSTNIEYFTIIEDITPPATTSDAKATYYQGALITLTATDDSTLGVKNTFYSLNGGPTQIGTKVVIPATNGTIVYTLTFWSVDWAGNEETPNSVSFTVSSGTGTIRLIWGDSDTNPDHLPTGNDWAQWTVRRGSFTGPVVATGSGASPGWDGVDDIAVQVGPTPYFVRIDWYWEQEDLIDQTDFPNVYVTTPGQIINLRY